MGNNQTRELTGRVNVRTPDWMEDYVRWQAEVSNAFDESQVARDLLELGIIFSNMAKDGHLHRLDSEIKKYSRPQGEYPDDSNLQCPGCLNDNQFLFRHRQKFDVYAITCLVCNNHDEADKFQSNTDHVQSDEGWECPDCGTLNDNPLVDKPWQCVGSGCNYHNPDLLARLDESTESEYE